MIFITFEEKLQMTNRLCHCLQKTQISQENPLPATSKPFCEQKQILSVPLKPVKNSKVDDFSLRF